MNETALPAKGSAVAASSLPGGSDPKFREWFYRYKGGTPSDAFGVAN